MPTFRTRGSGPTRRVHPINVESRLEDYLKSLETSATRVCELCPDRPEFSSQERLRQHFADYHLLTPTLMPESIQRLVEYLRSRRVVSHGVRDRSLAEKMSDIDRFSDVMHIPSVERERFALIIRRLGDRKTVSFTLSPEVEERLKDFPVEDFLSENPEVLRNASERLYTDLTFVATKDRRNQRVHPAEAVGIIRTLIERARERGKGALSDEEERERIRKAVAASRAKKKATEVESSKQ